MYSRLRASALRPSPSRHATPQPAAARCTILLPPIRGGQERVFTYIEGQAVETAVILRMVIDREINQRQARALLAAIGYEDWEIVRYLAGIDVIVFDTILAWVVVTALVAGIITWVVVLS